MEGFGLPEVVHQWVTDVLVWIGFGTVVGLAARALVPGRDPAGAVLTLGMGIAGTVIGCGSLAFFWTGHRVTPVSPMGFVVAIAGASVLILFHRLLGGKFSREEKAAEGHPTHPRSGRRQPVAAHKD